MNNATDTARFDITAISDEALDRIIAGLLSVNNPAQELIAVLAAYLTERQRRAA